MNTLSVPENLFHLIETRARNHGTTVDAQVAELLTKALAEDVREAELMAEIRKERDEVAGRGFLITDDFINEAKRSGARMIVTDTNILAYLLIPGAETPIIEGVRAKDCNWTAPPLIRFELLNVVAKAIGASFLTRDAGLRSFRRGMNLVNISKLQSDPLFIFNMNQSTGCSPYDLEFVWLAMELGVPLVTSNQNILKAFPTVAVEPGKFV